MAYVKNYFLKKQGIKSTCLCNWASFLFTLNILFLMCKSGDSMVLKFDLETMPQEGRVKVSFNLTQENEAKTGNNSELCKNATFDAIFTYQGETYVLKGDHYWKLMNNGVAPEYPKLISQKWPGLPNNIDTAFTDKKGQFIYFFKGSQYWKFEGDKLEEGPNDIKKDFPGVPDNLQAAVVWNGNGQLYLFKGEHYWSVDMSKKIFEVSEKTDMKYWLGIPGDLDAALQSSGFVTYFFKDGKYYKYDDKREKVVIDDPPYPRNVASNWFGCPKVFKLIEY